MTFYDCITYYQERVITLPNWPPAQLSAVDRDQLLPSVRHGIALPAHIDLSDYRQCSVRANATQAWTDWAGAARLL